MLFQERYLTIFIDFFHNNFFFQSLSSHPSLSEWPPNAINAMNESLRKIGEWEYYEAANKALDQRILELKDQKSTKIFSKSSFSSSLGTVFSFFISFLRGF